MEICSPVASSTSISLADGRSVMARARSMSSSVMSPGALTTTTMSFPCFFFQAMRLATRRYFSGVATEEPPNFCTTIPKSAPPLLTTRV